ncbi:MAG: glycosyltransferase [Candidatus Lokiarchaeota archaeon]|nr:glycosyltransferase [Candidatus Lokiarchaeota archaeon]
MVQYAAVINIWNEENRIDALFDELEKQTKKPALWIWIDDGSTDDSVVRIEERSQDSSIPVLVLRAPTKQKGDFDSIGKAWNHVFDKIQSLKGYDYLLVVDSDCHFPRNYAENMIDFMESHENYGVAAGQVRGETRLHMPMNAGKIVRWEIVDSIERFWDIVPDTFWNIRALFLGYDLAIRPDIIIDASPSAGFTRKGRFRYGRLSYYVGTHFLRVLFEAMKFLLTGGMATAFLHGYFYEWSKGDWKCDIPMIRKFYSLSGLIRWRLSHFL